MTALAVLLTVCAVAMGVAVGLSLTAARLASKARLTVESALRTAREMERRFVEAAGLIAYIARVKPDHVSPEIRKQCERYLAAHQVTVSITEEGPVH